MQKYYSILFRGGLTSYSPAAWKYRDMFLPKSLVKPDQDEKQRFWVPEWLCKEKEIPLSHKYCWMQDGVKVSIHEVHIPSKLDLTKHEYDPALTCTDRINTEAI